MSEKRKPDFSIMESLSPSIRWTYAVWINGETATLSVSAYENGKWYVKLKKELKKQ